MRLTVVVPDRVLVDAAVEKVVAEGVDGSFCLKPRHIDVAVPLEVGLVTYVAATDRAEGKAPSEQYLAVDQGLLVKCGERVRVSVRRAVPGEDLEELQRTVREVYRRLSREEREARRASGRLEASFVRRFMELEEGR